MEFVVIGLAASFNLFIIYLKIEKKKFINAALDVLALVILSSMFGQFAGGMVIATVASAVISLFLMIKNPTLDKTLQDDKIKNFIEEFKSRCPQQ